MPLWWHHVVPADGQVFVEMQEGQIVIWCEAESEPPTDTGTAIIDTQATVQWRKVGETVQIDSVTVP